MSIVITYKSKMYTIDGEPFETYEETYRRGWFIIKNMDKYANYDELVSMSILHNNVIKKMEYCLKDSI